VSNLKKRKKNNSEDFNVRISNHQLKQNDHIKYLGVMIDNKLNWQTHIQNICSKLAKAGWAIVRLRKYVNLGTLLKVYYAMAYSHLQYSAIN